MFCRPPVRILVLELMTSVQYLLRTMRVRFGRNCRFCWKSCSGLCNNMASLSPTQSSLYWSYRNEFELLINMRRKYWNCCHNLIERCKRKLHIWNSKRDQWNRRIMRLYKCHRLINFIILISFSFVDRFLNLSVKLFFFNRLLIVVWKSRSCEACRCSSLLPTLTLVESGQLRQINIPLLNR